MTAMCPDCGRPHASPHCPAQDAGNSPEGQDVQALASTVRSAMGDYLDPRADPKYEAALDALVAAIAERDALLGEAQARVEELQRQLADLRGFVKAANEDAEAAEARIADADDRAYKADCFAIDARMERDRLKDALRVALDCRGPYDGTVSRHGGYPAICSECAEKARAALVGLDP